MRDKPDKRLKRETTGPLATNDSYGNNGVFFVVTPNKVPLQIISTDQGGWEHVSISPLKAKRTPTWEEMCFVKDLFWSEEEAVVQYHPPKSVYVNAHKYTLHLWRPIDLDLPLPPPSMVGVVGLDNVTDVKDVVNNDGELTGYLVYQED